MSKTHHDPFDDRLSAMFDEAARPYRHAGEVERFTREVTARLSRPERFRVLALGAAGAAGALIAGSQLQRLLGPQADAAVSMFAQLPGASLAPELLVSLIMAAMALGFAAVLPRRSSL
ncbi:hypothetical protein E5163_13825 [Marinicauda algicola]|uniref:Uncharacterized protein n=1 Tax=Marinicauda algicola TaxID=2029849 RepID=A0A4V3RXV6_9PROT|nr:hypothetical protein [Marinicauda algicola]TGY87979.1 hypothetical protein E5163_13825 [Marinicauda algicola]